MPRRRLMALWLGAGLLSGCESPLDAGAGALQANAPQQFVLLADPEPLFIRNDTFVVRFLTTDSMPHITWTPSRFVVEGNGSEQTHEVLPHHCLLPSTREDTFFFEWLTCDRIFLLAERLLTGPEIAAVEARVSGRYSHHFPLQMTPGGYYVFRVPVGRAQTARAARLAESLRFISESDRLPNPPPCVLSESFPPPPCPPWSLVAFVPVSVLPEGEAFIRYEEPDGRVRRTRICLECTSEPLEAP